MRGGPVRLACLSALLGLLLCAPAQAKPQAQPRIINGHPASAGEYPAQGVLSETPVRLHLRRHAWSATATS